MLSVADLVALRYRVSDGALMDLADLDQLLDPPCRVTTEELKRHWICSQSVVSRRMKRLWDADLIEYRVSGRAYLIRRLGLLTTEASRVRHRKRPHHTPSPKPGDLL
jgi:hypothetical protein